MTISYRESRRANALLRSNHLGDPLHTLLMANGELSPLFPKDLTALFGLDGTSFLRIKKRATAEI